LQLTAKLFQLYKSFIWSSYRSYSYFSIGDATLQNYTTPLDSVPRWFSPTRFIRRQ